MSSTEPSANVFDPESKEAALREPPRVVPEGFLFYVALGLVIAVAIYNASFLHVTAGIDTRDGFLKVVFLDGTFCGEAGLLVIAAVLGTGPVWLRMALALGVAWCWITSAYFGASSFSEQESHDLLQMFVLSFLCFPLFFLSAQVSLWICRILLRWRVEPLGNLPKTPQPQLTIAGILCFTTAVAVAVGLVELVPVGHASEDQYVVGEDNFFPDRIMLWEFVGGYLLIFIILISLTTAPLTAFVLRPRNRWIGAGLTALWFLILTGSAEIWLFAALRDFYWFVPWRLALSILGLFIAIAAPLFLLRRWNYRLRWGRE